MLIDAITAYVVLGILAIVYHEYYSKKKIAE